MIRELQYGDGDVRDLEGSSSFQFSKPYCNCAPRPRASLGSQKCWFKHRLSSTTKAAGIEIRPAR